MEFIKRFIYLKEESYYYLIALWIVGTHLFKDFEYYGYLFIYSADKGCGKSRLLKLLNRLVYKSSGCLVSLTEAVLFRDAGDITQLIDEMDSAKDTGIFRSVLNSGFERGAMVKRNREKKGDFVLKELPIYNPRAIAGIGLNIIHETTRDRCFAIALVRQKQDEEREEYYSVIHDNEANTLHNRIAKWAEMHKAKVMDKYITGKYPYIYDFSNNRTRDISKSLAAIMETAYADSQELNFKRVVITKAISLTRNEKENCNNNDLIVIDRLLLIAECDTCNPLVGMASELAARCSNETEKIYEKDISRALRKYGFKPRSIRGEGGPRNRYSIDYKDLTDIISRYGSDEQRTVLARSPSEN